MAEEKAIEVLKQLGFSEADAQAFIEGCKKGLKAAKEGKVKPWSQVKKELGIANQRGGE